MAIEKYDSTSGQWQKLSVGKRGPKGLSSSLVAPSSVRDNLQEWWIYPVSTFVATQNRTVFGGYATTGKILVNEINHETGEEKRVEVADSLKIDDHNNPAVHVEAGRRIVIAWTNHSFDDKLRFKVSDTSGNIDSLTVANEQVYTTPGIVTYAQIHKINHLSNATNDVLWVFFRAGSTGWYRVQITVNQDTGNISFGTVVNVIQGDATAYLSTALSHKSDNRIRVSWYHNPASAYHALRYFEIDTVTGSIYSPMNGTSPIGNISGTGLPLLTSTVTPVLPEPDPGIARRMFYVRPGPAKPAIAYAEWDRSAPEQAVYKVIESVNETNNTWATHEFGIAGTRVGHTDLANYVGGMAFPDPCDRDIVLLTRNIGGQGVVEWHTKTLSVRTEERVYETTNWVGRPIITKYGGPAVSMFSDVTMYNSFADYNSKVVISSARPPFVSYPTTNDMKRGWGWITGDAVPEVTTTITFDTPFSSPPIVVASMAGEDRTYSQTTLPGFTDSSRLVSVEVSAITETGFVVSVRRTDGSNFPVIGGVHRRWAFTWMAMPQQ